MRSTFIWPRLFVAVAFAVTAWALVYRTGVANTDEAGIILHLPERVGDWHGVALTFCSNRDCGAQFAVPQLEDPTTCPQCGSPLSNMNWAERSMLPADTGLVRSYYRRTDGSVPVQTTIVLSGDDRSSIHRPQVCMVAAGHEIEMDRLIRIPLSSRPEKPLEVMVLDMGQEVKREDGSPGKHISYYAYWFVGKDRETASHIKRMISMGTDRVFRGVSHRWAYIAISGQRDPRSDAHLQVIADFASQLHPTLLKPE